MKSNFSRFLHHTLSRSDVREVFTSPLSLSDLIGESRSNQVADLSNLDYRVKPDNDGFCTGRSMVEMLGVLAIIGVLSVGAIAGYSKAMMKYKLNQHAVAVNMLINNVLAIKDKLEHSGDSSTRYNILLNKANMLPDGIFFNGNTNLLEDRYFKNKINIEWSRAKWTLPDGTSGQDNIGVMRFYFNPTDEGHEVCRNILNAAKENADNIYAVSTYSRESGDSGLKQTSFVYGNNMCRNGLQCLKNLSLDNIATLCNNCKAGTCILGIIYR